MIALVMVFVVIVAGLIGVGYYVDQDYIKSNINQVLSFTTSVNCNEVGDCISFNIPTVPENHNTIPVDYDIDAVGNATYSADGTLIPQQSYVTGVINDVSYSSTGSRESSYKSLGNVMMVQIGNIISVDATISIIDPNTGEVVEPRTVKYTLFLSCSDLSEFCNEKSISRRGTTQSDGSFNERITTDLTWFPALYEIEVFGISETVNEFGIPYDVSNTLFVEGYK